MKYFPLIKLLTISLFLGGMAFLQETNAQTIKPFIIDGDFGPVSVKFNKNGLARYAIKVPPKSKQVFSLNGRSFKNVEVKKLKGDKCRYELYEGSKLLSSGHVTWGKIKINSNGKSSYQLSVIADDVVINVVLELQELK